jgi:hypothetical protein
MFHIVHDQNTDVCHTFNIGAEVEIHI